MGRKQRLAEFVGLTDDEVQAIARDPKHPLRRKARTELKFRGLANQQKRRKRRSP